MPSFPFDLYLAAFAGAALGSCLSLPLWRAWCLRAGQMDDPGHRKIHTVPVPLAGGLAVVTGLLVPVGVGALILFTHCLPGSANEILVYGLKRRAFPLLAILAGALGMLGLGWLDDRYELRPVVKFSGQLIIAALVAAAGVRITLFVHWTWFSYAVTLFWILSVTNAFNFMDNMNGLCTGLGAVAMTYFALSAAIQGQYLVATLALAGLGALLGFLPYNFPQATAFLGDAGSHLTGFLCAVMAILPHFYSRQNPNVWSVLNPLLFLAVPLGDLVWVVVLRQRAGRPFYIGDTNHLSHRLVQRGFTPSCAVLTIWLLAALLGALAFL